MSGRKERAVPEQSKKQNKNCKYIFVTGGVLSGVGKGITAASIGAILKAKGYKVSIQKCDPYLNVDAGLLNPVEHGECFVTHDGAETDLDLGHYERFLDIETNKYSITLSGAINKELIEKERSCCATGPFPRWQTVGASSAKSLPIPLMRCCLTSLHKWC